MSKPKKKKPTNINWLELLANAFMSLIVSLIVLLIDRLTS